MAPDIHAYFNLNARLQRLLGSCLELLQEHDLFSLSKTSTDMTALLALAYEIMRLEVSESVDNNIELGVTKHTFGEKRQRVTSNTSEINDIIAIKFFFDEDIYLKLRSALEGAGITSKLLNSLDEIQRFLSSKKSAMTWEVSSLNISTPTLDQSRIPVAVHGENKSDFRKAFFLLRWGIIAGYAFDSSFSNSIEAITKVKNQIRSNVINPDPNDEAGNLHAIYWNEVFQIDGITESQRKHLGKLISIPNRLWALWFMHADYSNLMQWGEEDQTSQSFLTDFVMNRLGPFLLYTKYEKNWSWKKESDWNKILKETGRKSKGFRLPDYADSQPVRAGGKLYAFEYLKRVRPSLEQELGEEVNYIDTKDFLTSMFSPETDRSG